MCDLLGVLIGPVVSETAWPADGSIAPPSPPPPDIGADWWDVQVCWHSPPVDNWAVWTFSLLNEKPNVTIQIFDIFKAASITHNATDSLAEFFQCSCSLSRGSFSRIYSFSSKRLNFPTDIFNVPKSNSLFCSNFATKKKKNGLVFPPIAIKTAIKVKIIIYLWIFSLFIRWLKSQFVHLVVIIKEKRHILDHASLHTLYCCFFLICYSVWRYG